MGIFIMKTSVSSMINPTTSANVDYMIDMPTTSVPLVLVGDVFTCLKRIPSHSISCIVTSPPYWKLRDYYSKEQIGQESDPEEYINKLIMISRELLRIMKKDGAYFLNIGDTYSNGGLQMIPQRVAYGMLKDVKREEGRQGKRKVGWLLRNQIIWYKPDHMPSPVTSRYTNTYEPIYYFTRNDWEKRVSFNLDAIRVPYRTQSKLNDYLFPLELSDEEYEKLRPSIRKENEKIKYNGKFKENEVNIGASPGGRKSVTGIQYVRKRRTTLPLDTIVDYLTFWRKKQGVTIKEIDRILGYKHTASHWFRRDKSGSLPKPKDWLKLKEVLNFDDQYDKEMVETMWYLQTIRRNPKGRNPGDLWNIKCAKFSNAHFSVFPEQIPKNAILACCPKDGIVLDPFGGSGTTAKVAKQLGRKSILIEVQPDFLPIIKQRCGSIDIVHGSIDKREAIGSLM